VYSGEHIDLFILLVQEILQFPDFCFQSPNTIFQRLGIASGEGSSTQLITCLALKPDVGALRATRADAVASCAGLALQMGKFAVSAERETLRATWAVSYRIFLLLHLSQACAIRLCGLFPTRMTFIGRIPGIFAAVDSSSVSD
jgi:hypothetical protein